MNTNFNNELNNNEITGGRPSSPGFYNGILKDNRGNRVHHVATPVFNPLQLTTISPISTYQVPVLKSPSSVLQRTPYRARADSPVVQRIIKSDSPKRKPKVLTPRGAFDYDSKFIKHTFFGPVFDYAAHSESQNSPKSPHRPNSPFDKNPRAYISSNIKNLDLGKLGIRNDKLNSPLSSATRTASYETTNNGIKLRINLHDKNKVYNNSHSTPDLLNASQSPQNLLNVQKNQNIQSDTYIRFGDNIKDLRNDKVYSGVGVMITALKNNKDSLILSRQNSNVYEDLGGKINFNSLNVENKNYNQKILSFATMKKVLEKTNNTINFSEDVFERTFGGKNSYVDIQYQNTYYRSYLFSLNINFDNINQVFNKNKTDDKNLVSINLNRLFTGIKNKNTTFETDTGNAIQLSTRTTSILTKLFEDYQSCCGLFNMTTDNKLSVTYNESANKLTI